VGKAKGRVGGSIDPLRRVGERKDGIGWGCGKGGGIRGSESAEEKRAIGREESSPSKSSLDPPLRQ